jgi:peptide/nickel transport system substrate-binding protein
MFFLHSDPQAQGTQMDAKVIGAPQITQPGVAGGELLFGSNNVPGSLNPIFGGNPITAVTAAGLLELNAITLDYEPAVASSYTVSADNTSIQVTLRSGIKWSDGELVTADDVVFTFVTLLQNSGLLQNLANFGNQLTLPAYTITSTDAQHLTFSFPNKDASQMVAPLTLPLFPKHIFPNVDAPNFFQQWSINTPADQVVGLGAFHVLSFTSNGDNNNPVINDAVVERNPNYWKKDQNGTTLPYVNKLTFKFLPQAADLNTMLGNGQLDLLGGGGSDADVALAAVPGVTMVVGDPFVTADSLIFNEDAADANLKTLFRDDRFRQALAHTLDRNKLTNQLTDNAKFLAPRENAAYFKSPFFNEAATTKFVYDLNAAKQLLDQIGLKDTNGDGIREFADGKPVKFDFNTNDNNSVRVAAGEELTSIWKSLGLDVNYLVEPFAALQGRFDFNNRKASFDIQLIAFGIGINTIQDVNYLNCQYASNGFCHVQRFSDPGEATERQKRIDDIFTKLNGPALSSADQTALENELQTLISQDLGQIPLWTARMAVAIRSGVHNAESVGVFGVPHSLEYIWKS